MATIWNNNCVQREKIKKFENVYEKKRGKIFFKEARGGSFGSKYSTWSAIDI